MSAPTMALEKSAPSSLASIIWVWNKLVPMNLAPREIRFQRPCAVQLTPEKFAPLKLQPLMRADVSFVRVRSMPLKIELVETLAGQIERAPAGNAAMRRFDFGAGHVGFGELVRRLSR